MKRLFVSVLLICALASFAFGQKKMSSANDFQSLLNKYYAAWSTLNPDNAADFYAKDSDAVFFDLAPLKYNNWAEYSDTFKKTVAPMFSSLTFALASICFSISAIVCRRAHVFQSDFCTEQRSQSHSQR